MSNFDNISLKSRDRFGRWISPAIENNLSTDASQHSKVHIHDNIYSGVKKECDLAAQKG